MKLWKSSTGKSTVGRLSVPREMVSASPELQLVMEYDRGSDFMIGPIKVHLRLDVPRKKKKNRVEQELLDLKTKVQLLAARLEGVNMEVDATPAPEVLFKKPAISSHASKKIDWNSAGKKPQKKRSRKPVNDSAKKRRTEESPGRNLLSPTQDLMEAVNAMKREPLQIIPSKQNQSAIRELAAFIRDRGK